MWSAPSRSTMPPCGCSWDLRDDFLMNIDALDDDAIAVAQDLEDLAALALLGAGKDDDLVVLLDVELGLRMARLVDTEEGHGLDDLRREGNDLHEVLFAQLAGDRPEDAGAARSFGPCR